MVAEFASTEPSATQLPLPLCDTLAETVLPTVISATDNDAKSSEQLTELMLTAFAKLIAENMRIAAFNIVLFDILSFFPVSFAYYSHTGMSLQR